MKVNGIIAEYNPFHNGHLYHMETCRRLTGADYTVVVMSGSFVQRGAPALLGKRARAEMVLRCGADLVLELPARYATGSAESFAAGAVGLLDALQTVDYLCFGSEWGREKELMEIAAILVEEPEDFRRILQAQLREGLSFPAARAAALRESRRDLECAAQILDSPNNILGIEYGKALLRLKDSGRPKQMQPVTIKRAGDGYHETESAAACPSALSLRRLLLAGRTSLPEILKEQIPLPVREILSREQAGGAFLQSDDFSSLLLYRLLSEEENGYAEYADVTEELSDRIRKNLYQFQNWEQFCQLLKSRDLTYTRISRCLTHILLGIRREPLHERRASDSVPYARILGLRREAAPLLSAIKSHSAIPLLSKLADAPGLLTGEALEMLREDVRISHIYNGVRAGLTGTAIQNEYSTPLVIL